MGNSIFKQEELDAIAAALGHTEDGLTGSEIANLLPSAKLPDPSPTLKKRHRIYNAFVEYQNKEKSNASILAFIRKSMKPSRYIGNPDRYERLRHILNTALSFSGLAVSEGGELHAIEAVKTLSDAQDRARKLRAGLSARSVHEDVLRFCREELLVDDYFHAVQEAVKSIADKIRDRTGLDLDGADLVERAFAGELPMLAINTRAGPNEIGEQRGFVSLLKGVFSMFRNPTAHAPRIHWPMTQQDAEDLLSLVSLIHRRLDAAHMPPRPT